MSRLNGGTTRVALGRGVMVRAPGIVGTADLLPPTLLGARDGEPERATPALAAALAAQQLTPLHSVEIAARPATGPVAAPVRGVDGRAGLVLEVPDVGPLQRQVVLLTDENGIVTWHFATDGAPPGSVRFVVPADTVVSPGADGAPAASRGLVSTIGKKLLSVLVFPVVQAGVRLVAEQFASAWENSNRRAVLRRFSEPAHRLPTAVPLDGAAWDLLSGGPALLFVHGTFSTSHGGFGGLPDDVLAELAHRYGGRVFAYDHPTLSVDPLANAAALAGLVRPGERLSVDVVAHSRGGLVARAIAAAGADDASFPLRIARLVHVGTPNAGTALADVTQHAQLIDRITTMLNLVPDGPWSAVTDVLDGVLTVVKIIGVDGVGALPGLHAMDPRGDWLAKLAPRQTPPLTSFAIDADFEPVGSLLQLVRLKDSLVDRVFAELPNDMVVPAGGVRDAAAATGFPIPEDRRVSFDRTRAVWHCSYFSQPETATALRTWLTS